MIGAKKGNQSYLAIISRCAIVLSTKKAEKKQKGKKGNETTNQRTGKRARSRESIAGGRRIFPLTKQRPELHHGSEGWSFDCLWANPNRQGNCRTAVRNSGARTLGCDKNKQLDRVR